jgi:lysozyme
MGRNNLVYSNYGNTLTKGFESCHLIAYQDIKGIWTIGWGHTGPEVCAGLVWTQAQADLQLIIDEKSAVGAVNNLVQVILTQGEFDALVDFVFNTGGHAFATSTLLVKHNAGDYAGAANELLKWDHAGSQVVAGLLRRRTEERNEFNTGNING